jgi:hypothetical protein
MNFNFMPMNAGFVKLFAQFRIDGKNITVPFEIMVK